MNLFLSMQEMRFTRLLLLLATSLILFSLLVYAGYRVKKMRNNHTTTSIVIPADKIKKMVLKNGMQVLAFQNPFAPKVLVQIAYNIGSAVEDAGERGLAHLLEHLIFKGTDKLSETDIGAIARKYGARFNAFTGPDITSYYFETNKNNWQPFVELLAQCMENARFHDDFLASEVKAIIQELRMHRDNYVRLMTQKATELSFPPNHPYHDPVIGYKEDLIAMTAERVKNFYKKYYRPDRATIFIVGDINIDEALACAQQNFESIPVSPESVMKEFTDGFPELVTQKTRIFQDIKKERLGFYWAIPGIMGEGELASSALESLLGKGRGSRLYRTLVEEKKIASRVSTKNFKLMYGGIFFIFVEPMLGKAEKCRSAVQKILSSVIDEGFSQQELVRMINGKTRSFLEKMSNNKDFVYRWIKSYFSTGDELEIFKRLNRYQALTSKEIQSFAKKYLDPFLMNQIELIPVPHDKRDFIKASRSRWDEVEREIIKSHQRTTPLEKPRVAQTMKDPELLEFEFPKPDKVFELDNGLKVMIKKQNHWPIVAMRCELKESEYFARSRQGKAVDAMMNMLMEGNSHHSKNQIIKFFEQRGVKYRVNASGIRCVALQQDAGDVLEQMLNILVYPTFPKERIERLKSRKIDHYYRAYDAYKKLAKRTLLNIIYQGTQFSWTPEDIAHDFEHLTRADFMKLHQKYVSPANMILSVVGNFDVETMEHEIRRIFGSWNEGGSYLQPKLGIRDFQAKKQVDIPLMRNQVVLMMGQPSPLTIQDDALIPIQMINGVFFKSFGSRLYKLRERTGLFYSSSGKFAAGAGKFPGYDYVAMHVKAEQLDVAEQKIREVIAQMAANGIDETELASARQKYLKRLIDVTGSSNRMAKMFCRLDSLKVGFDHYDNVLKRIQNMTIDEVNKAAAQYINDDDMARVRVGRLEK